MIANPKWFKRRKYTGWGLTPITWQGWLYVIGILMSFAMIHIISIYFRVPSNFEFGLMFVLSVFMIVDVVDIMIRINKDERESMHEAIAERNVTWYLTAVLCIGVLYQIFYSIVHGYLAIDPFLFIALVGGAIVKGVSNWYLLDK